MMEQLQQSMKLVVNLLDLTDQLKCNLAGRPKPNEMRLKPRRIKSYECVASGSIEHPGRPQTSMNLTAEHHRLF